MALQDDSGRTEASGKLGSLQCSAYRQGCWKFESKAVCVCPAETRSKDALQQLQHLFSASSRVAVRSTNLSSNIV